MCSPRLNLKCCHPKCSPDEADGAVPFNMATDVGPSATGNPRTSRITLGPGHSLMDWIRLGRSGQDLTGVGSKKLKVTSGELSKHKKREDVWMAIHGEVYNVTPYLHFHPGGIDEIMRGAGKDATQIYDEVHSWVNVESMLKNCHVGTLHDNQKKGSLLPQGFKKPSVLFPRLRNAKVSTTTKAIKIQRASPTSAWMQDDDTVTLVISTSCQSVRREHVMIDRCDRQLSVTLLMADDTYQWTGVLQGDVTAGYKVSVTNGEVSISCNKLNERVTWKTITAQSEETFMKTADKPIHYRSCKLLFKATITYDTNLYCFALPPGGWMCVPLGHHVQVNIKMEDVSVSKSYTVVPPSLLADKQDVRVAAGELLYLMVKTYPHGVVSSYISQLSPGDSLQISDHMGSFDVDCLSQCQHLLLYAAGTGFTPMCGLLNHVLHEKPQSNRRIQLVFFNKRKEDILYENEIEQITLQANGRLEVHHVLSDASDQWTGLRGRICKELVEKLLPTPADHLKLCVCGPKPFTDELLRLAKEREYTDSMIHAFAG